MKSHDQELLEGIIRSDVFAYEDTYRRWFPVLRTFVFGMLKDSSRAEDIAQNVLMKLWLKRGTLDPEKSLKNYLFVLARNEIFNVLKSMDKRMMSYTDTLPENRILDSGTEDRIRLNDTLARIDSLVDSLPPKRREVFMLSRREYLDTEEIARRLGLSPRTVEKHLELALRDLRKHFN